MDGLFIEIAIEYAWCWKGIRFYRYFCFLFSVSFIAVPPYSIKIKDFGCKLRKAVPEAPS